MFSTAFEALRFKVKGYPLFNCYPLFLMFNVNLHFYESGFDLPGLKTWYPMIRTNAGSGFSLKPAKCVQRPCYRYRLLSVAVDVQRMAGAKAPPNITDRRYLEQRRFGFMLLLFLYQSGGLYHA